MRIRLFMNNRREEEEKKFKFLHENTEKESIRLTSMHKNKPSLCGKKEEKSNVS
jgi:hypothetical protein